MTKKEIDYYKRCAPYAFRRLKDGRYIALNSFYKPLDRDISYLPETLSEDAYLNTLLLEPDSIKTNFTKEEIDHLKETGDCNQFWLYTRDTSPWLNAENRKKYDNKISSNKKVKFIA